MPGFEDRKCICVPSGRCHSHTILGCPHPHYFDDKGVWRCGVPKNETKFDPTPR